MLDADGDGTISQREEAAADAERYSFNGVGSNNGNITLNGVGDDEGQSIAITGFIKYSAKWRKKCLIQAS